MKARKTIFRCLFTVAVLLTLAATVTSRAPLNGDRLPNNSFQDRPQFFPEPVTVDQVIHNKGNIVTTVDNWGYIGGYSYVGLPSGEWPRNSGHDYLAEIRYWIGTVTPAGDTLVANTYDDFQVIPAGLSSAEPGPNAILLSTDTSRYYNTYDPADTVGEGAGSPAYGWWIWNSRQRQWGYNLIYDPALDSLVPGGPTSLQESFYRFGDFADVPTGDTLLGLEMTHRVLQWNYCYNEDFMFMVLEITNESGQDYTDLAVGLYVDIDVGGPDGTGENGRLEDLVAFDSLENLAWIYDSKGRDPGWGPTEPTGIMGTKLLETPLGIGMTAFRTDDWAFLPNDDAGRFAMINSQQFDQSLPPTDQFYIQCVRGINLMADSTVRVVYALVAGQDETEFRENASLAQQLYDNYYVGPEPPPTPQLRARAGDRKVYLYWDDAAEGAIDPMSGVNDFVGYKLYRSDNQGRTWGLVDDGSYNTNNCLDFDYMRLASYAVDNPGDPIPHSFIDNDSDAIYNYVEYWYCVAAFDAGDSVTGIDPLQSAFGIAGESPNVVAVTPRKNPAGFMETAGDVVHEYYGSGEPSIGEVFATVFDESALQNNQYKVGFEDLPTITVWHLINETTGDTVLANQTVYHDDPAMFDIVEGLRVAVTNADRFPVSMGQTEFATGQTTFELDPGWFLGAYTPDWDPSVTSVSDAHYRVDYELRYTGDSTPAAAVNTAYSYWVPFEVWNITDSQRVSCAVYDFAVWIDDTTTAPDGVWQSWDLVIIGNYPYSPTDDNFAQMYPEHLSWWFGFDYFTFNPSVGDVITIEGPALHSPDDVFRFTADGISQADARANLDNIKVVPNPYFASFSALAETGEGESILKFTNLPSECTIRIYTLAGDLVKRIEHNDLWDGTDTWDLKSEAGRQVASGIYLFHVESPLGEHLGRFAVIK